jgi:hypothetical protein
MSDYDITKIPGIMRTKGWVNGATLMENWFARPANDHPDRDRSPDTTTIKMAWALSFQRAREVYDEMVSQKVWVNAKASAQIVRMLQGQGLLTGQKREFGPEMDDVVRLDREYIQFRPVGSMSDPHDDMLAALGRFVFRVAVNGHIVPRGKQHLVNIEQVGIYIWDSYDFNGDQPLGFWSDSDFAGNFNFIGGSYVSNASFRDYRSRHSKGGDYHVFSDVRILHRSPPDQIVV